MLEFVASFIFNKVTFGVAGFLVLLKVYVIATTGRCRSKRRMDGQTVIVTGANSGIGKETARDMARRGARVILACRDITRGNAARDDIISSTGNRNVEMRLLNLASLKSVREFAADILRTEERLDVLVNNAGVGGLAKKYTEDNVLLTMQINHVAPFLLTHLLLGLLKASAPSRIVMVSSGLHKLSKGDLDNWNGEKNFGIYDVYNNTKLANVMTTMDLTEKLKGTGVTANSLHPGVVDTAIFDKFPGYLRILLHIFRPIFFKTAEEGAQTSIYVAVSEEVEGVSGRYFTDCRLLKMSWSLELNSNLLLVAVGAVTIGGVLVVVALRLFACLTLGVCKSRRKMDGKTVIVTGANSGIGRETAKDLAKRGARVIMACRTMATANKARQDIVDATGNSNVVVKKLDLSSFKSIRDFAAEINRTERRLDVLVHNAGTANTFNRQTTEDGLELTMATNHFGPFLLTHLLIDLLKRSSPSRIVVVGSELYRLSRLNLNNLNPVSGFPAYLYYVSKFANIVFCQELSRRLQGTGVTANVLHPGMIDSGIWRNVPFPMNLPLKLIIKGFFKSPEQGAQTTIHLAVSETVEGVTGKYFIDCKESSLSTSATDPATARKLWELSEQFVKLTPNDRHI